MYIKDYNSFINEIVDNRKVLTWKNIEKDIQKTKKGNLILSGDWKIFKENRENYIVYLVDGDWVRNNLTITFGMGGHGLVHEFIPMNEIWVSFIHTTGELTTPEYIESCTIHEIAECEMMKTGKNYWNSHNKALDIESDLNLIPLDQIYGQDE